MAGFLAFTKEKLINHIVEVDVEEIFPNPHQPRTEFDVSDMQSLAESIAQNGILQPLTVRRGDGHYELVAGERRLRAAKLVGMQVVPCIVLDISSRNSAIMALVENI
ncbi:MAG: ParB/RepB/Spo0J family partition protein [Ruminococcus sp.]|nr:ParB/RepB/Spo0J family partition protein [Ruminococcus sp.]